MSLPQDKNDYIDGSIIGISGINDDDGNNNSSHVAHNESNINNSAFIATDDYYSTSSSDKSERNESIDVSVVFASEDYNSKNNDGSIIIKSSPTVAKKKKKKKELSSNANKDTERVNPSSVKPKDNEEEKEEERGVGCNNKEAAVLVLPPSNKNTVDFNINTNNGSSSTIIGKSNNDILGIVHFSDSISEKGRDDNGGSNKNVAEQPVLYNTEDDGSSSTFSSKPYPADTYSLLSLHGPVGNPGFFSYGLMVYLFQMTFLVLMVLSVIHPNWSSNGDGDNPDADGGSGSLLARLVQLAEFVPSNVSPLVRATQITATLSYIIFADSTVLDVVTAVELFPRFNQATSDDKLGCMVFASILRLSQGIFAITVTLLLIVTSSTTIEIILNFTAINFISTLDNVGFKIIKWGKYGPKFEEEAKRIETLPLPRCIYRKYKHVRYLCTIIPVGVMLFSMICSMIILQESNNHWVTKIFRVQFQDKEQGLQVYNGCYKKNEDAINRYEGFRRKLYESFVYNSESARFGYCIDDRRWILFKGDSFTNACEARGNDNELARSSKTDTFDVSTMFEEQWYSSSNTPLDVYFIKENGDEENGDIELNNNTCSSFINDGNCDSFFNKFDFQYDGGDCCAATCSRPKCGIGSLKNTFNTTNATGDGFPDCTDPDMVPITIRLDNILSSFEPQFQDYFYSNINEVFYGFNKSSTINDILRNSVGNDDYYNIERLRKDPIKPLLFIDCDGSNVLNIYVDKSMENQTETIMVSDGADCTMTIRNDGSYNSPIWYADYTILHGDKQSATFTAPPTTFTAPPATFTAPPATFTAPPATFTAPATTAPATTAPATFTAPPATFTAPPATFTAPPATAPPATTAPATTAPATFTAPPATFTAPPATFTAPPATTAPATTAPATTAPATFTAPPATFTAPPATFTAPPATFTAPPATFTAPPATFTAPPATFTAPPATFTAPPATFTAPPATFTAPPATFTAPPATFTAPEPTSVSTGGSSSIVVAESSSAKESTYVFRRIPECYFDKLSDYIDNSTVYTGIDYDPTAKAINWLMYDESENSMCENPFILERYALAVIYFAAYNSPNYTLNRTTTQCVWPSIICDEGTVISLEMTDNDFTGTIPSEIGLLNSLTSLGLEFNKLTGSIPSEIGLMTSLTRLSLYINDLTGTIPSEIRLLTSLEELLLHYNNLTGTFPNEIRLLTSLTSLGLDGNTFTGSIPSEIGLMTSLESLHLDNNAFTGSIPSEIGLLTSLTHLHLGGNDLTGTFPSEIGLMTSLTRLTLYSNDLTGTFPNEIGLLNSLEVLDLVFNAFTGSIPSEIGLLTSLTNLYLTSNPLNGTIPSEIGLMTSLESIYLDNNDLTGTFPSEIGLLNSLEELVLDSNELNGSIPSEIGLLTSLTTLYLYDNALNGPFPSEIGLLTSLYESNFLFQFSNHT